VLGRQYETESLKDDLRPAQHAEPLLGTWILDLSRSRFYSRIPFYGGTPPGKRVMIFERLGDGFRHVVETTTLELRETYRLQYVFKIDGRDYPADPQMPVDVVSFRRIDAYAIERTARYRQKVIETMTSHVSEDQKTLTVIQQGNNYDSFGNTIEVSSTQVFTRQ
jgi:hypothetical protein